MSFVANFIRFLAVQNFWESVKIWQSYREFKGGNFIETQCNTHVSKFIITSSRPSVCFDSRISWKAFNRFSWTFVGLWITTCSWFCIHLLLLLSFDLLTSYYRLFHHAFTKLQKTPASISRSSAPKSRSESNLRKTISIIDTLQVCFRFHDSFLQWNESAQRWTGSKIKQGGAVSHSQWNSLRKLRRSAHQTIILHTIPEKLQNAGSWRLTHKCSLVRVDGQIFFMWIIR